ncbi:probable glucoamylase at N-terminal half [Coccomyxa sp. Obi]|nr:probable glucoamylase at N-terminal half [Coccomyxa sp. Obi]
MPAMHSRAAQPGCGAQQLLRPCAFGGRKPFHAGTARDPVAACKRQFSSITSKKTFYRGIYIIRPASPGSLHSGLPRERRGALKCAASSGSTVRLTTQHEVAFGEVIKAVGTQEELGAWDPVAAPGLTWSDGNNWSVDLQLPPGSYEFKLVVVREDGTAVEWEAGPNREIMVEEAKDDVIEAECTWSNTTATLVTEEGEGTEGVLKVEAEGSSLAEAAASPTAAAQFQPDPTPDQIASGTLEVAAEGTKVADAAGGPVAQAVFKTDASPEGKESGGLPVGLQVFVGTLALFAVPVVAWSLYTLNTTGCGLPPGPGGALGALEGVSYVTLLGVVAWSIGMKATTSKGLPPGPGGLLGAAEGLSYLSLAAGAVVLVLQVKNYGYVPSALPDARCFGDEGPKSPSDITKALADAFASASRDAPPLSDSLQDAGTSGRPAASSVADSAASSSRAAASEASAQGTSVPLGWMRPTSPWGLQNSAWLPTGTLAMLPAVAAADSEQPVAPGDAAAGQAVQAAKRKINTALVSQQDRLEEVYAGALDGLSGADIESAVDELENVFSRIARVLGDALPSLGEVLSGLFSRADRPQPLPQQQATVVSGWLSGAVDPLPSTVAAGSTGQTLGPAAAEERVGLSMASPSAGFGSALPLTAGDSEGHTVFLDVQRENFLSTTEQLQEGADVGSWRGTPQNHQVGLVQVAFDLSDLAVPADIGFTAAATNAVSAAVNVNSQLTQQVIAPLRTAADDVRRIADEIARLAAAVDGEAAAGRPEALAQSTEALEAALGSAEKTVSGANSGLPTLVKQLEDAVAALNKACCPPEGVKEEKVSAVLQKLEAAMTDLRNAAESRDVTSSLQSAQAQVEALDTLPGAGAKAASETEPAVKSIEKAVDGLHSVLTELEAAVGAAKDISLPPAPPLKD